MRRSHRPATGADETSSFQLLGDRPSVEGDRDSLGFASTAAGLGNLIVTSRAACPFALGIEGGWGSGKSSLMGRLRVELEAQAAANQLALKTVSFNAWTSEGSSALEGLIKSVLNAMDKSVLRKAMRNKKLISSARAAALIVGGFLRVGHIVDAVWKSTGVDPQARNQLQALIADAVENWTKKTDHGGALIAVFIDDLDRCSPENVFQVFEAIKVYLDVPGFVFVLGFDQSVISDAILAEKKYSAETTRRAYLEKIIQVSYRISVPDDDQAEVLLDAYLEESNTLELLNPNMRLLVRDRNDRNPRRIKRFINGFVLQYRLDAEWEVIGAEILIQVLILERYFPTVANLFIARESDPLTEFNDYVALRQVLHQGSPATEIAEALRPFGVAPSGDNDVTLARVEEDLPEEFRELATDPHFVALAEGLRDAPNYLLLKSKLERRSSAPTITLEDSEVSPSSSTGGPRPGDPRRIFWIDDHPDKNRGVVDRLRGNGWQIEEFVDAEHAKHAAAGASDVVALVSDLTRDKNPDAGFDGLESLRSRLPQTPAIFYSSRITPARRKRAESLNAQITNQPDQLVDALERLLPR